MTDRPKTRLNWTVKGNGPSVLCLHGFTDHAASYDLIAPLLAGYRLLIPDLPGHGKSAAIDPVTFEAVIEIIRGDLEAMASVPSLVVGHSMGSALACRMAAAAPRLKGLVLIATALRPLLPQSVVDAIMGLEDPVTLDGSGLETWHECRHPVDRDFIAIMRSMAEAMCATQWKLYLKALQSCDLTTTIPDIVCPILVLHGEHDEIFPVAGIFDVAALARRVEVHMLPDLGHNLHWEAPQNTARIIGRFFIDCCGCAAPMSG